MLGWEEEAGWREQAAVSLPQGRSKSQRHMFSRGDGGVLVAWNKLVCRGEKQTSFTKEKKDWEP